MTKRSAENRTSFLVWHKRFEKAGVGLGQKDRRKNYGWKN